MGSLYYQFTNYFIINRHSSSPCNSDLRPSSKRPSTPSSIKSDKPSSVPPNRPNSVGPITVNGPGPANASSPSGVPPRQQHVPLSKYTCTCMEGFPQSMLSELNLCYVESLS